MTPDMERLHVISPSLTSKELARVKELALTEITRAVESSLTLVMADMEKFCGGATPEGFVKSQAIKVLNAQAYKLKKTNL